MASSSSHFIVSAKAHSTEAGVTVSADADADAEVDVEAETARTVAVEPNVCTVSFTVGCLYALPLKAAGSDVLIQLPGTLTQTAHFRWKTLGP